MTGYLGDWPQDYADDEALNRRLLGLDCETKAQQAERIGLEDAMATASLQQIADAMTKREDALGELEKLAHWLNDLASVRSGHSLAVLRKAGL